MAALGHLALPRVELPRQASMASEELSEACSLLHFPFRPAVLTFVAAGSGKAGPSAARMGHARRAVQAAAICALLKHWPTARPKVRRDHPGDQA